MDYRIKEALLQRNQRIIQAVKAKASLVCPGAVDLIAIVGSFANGEYHEKSDLDLLVIINHIYCQSSSQRSLSSPSEQAQGGAGPAPLCGRI